MTNVDRALLLAEWSAIDGRDADKACPCCRAWVCTGSKHEPGCAMDLALSERGYCTQVERDHARGLIRQVAATAPTLSPEKP